MKTLLSVANISDMNTTLRSFWFILNFDKQNSFLEVSCLYFRPSFVYRQKDSLWFSQKIHSPYILLMSRGRKS